MGHRRGPCSWLKARSQKSRRWGTTGFAHLRAGLGVVPVYVGVGSAEKEARSSDAELEGSPHRQERIKFTGEKANVPFWFRW